MNCQLCSQNQLRWPLQVGVSAGLASLVLAVPPSCKAFFGLTSCVAPVFAVFTVDATVGGSLKRAWLNVLFNAFGALVGYFFYVICLLYKHYVSGPLVPVISLLSAVLIVLPGMLARLWFPSTALAVNIGLSTAEIVFLGGYWDFAQFQPLQYALKRILASTVGCIFAALASQYILPHSARPTTANSLATILSVLSDVLKLLGGSGVSSQPHLSRVTSMSALLFSNYSSVNGSSKRIHSDSNLYDLSSSLRSQSLLLGELEQERLQCDEMVKNINICQELLSLQPSLIECAKQEWSFKKPHRFPREKYCLVLNEIRTLFFHIASLVFALSMHLTTLRGHIPYKHSKCDNCCYNGIKKKKRFLYPHDSWISGKKFIKSLQNQIVPKNKQAEPEKTTVLHIPTQNDNLGDSPCSVYLDLYNVYSATSLEAPWDKLEDTILSSITLHISHVLSLLSDCLRERKTCTTALFCSMEKLSGAIREIEVYRKSQRKNFSEIILTTLEAEMAQEWTSHNVDHINACWTGALGIDVATYMSLTESEQADFWDAYWLARDRISACHGTLTAIKNSLSRCSIYINDYVSVALHSNDTVFHVFP